MPWSSKSPSPLKSKFKLAHASEADQLLWVARNMMYKGGDRDNASTVALAGFQIAISYLGHVTL